MTEPPEWGHELSKEDVESIDANGVAWRDGWWYVDDPPPPSRTDRVLDFLFDSPAGYYLGGFLSGSALTASVIALVLTL